MKREELKKIVEYKLFRINQSSSRLPDLTRKIERINDEFVETPIEEDKWFLNIKELKDEFEILKKEVKVFLRLEREVAEFYKTYKCNHFIQINDYESGFNFYQQRCVLCGMPLLFSDKYLHSKNDCVVFLGDEVIDPYDGWVKTHYTETQILNIILDICNNSSEEDIDIIKELKKLKLEYVDYIRNANKKFVMFVIGTNKTKIDDYTYFNSDNNIYYDSFIDRFRQMLGVHLTIVGNGKQLEKYKSDESIELIEYSNIEELEKGLKYFDDKYDLIIDMSSLYKISVIKSNIIPKRYKIDYSKMFPSARVLKVNDLSKDVEDKLIKYLNKNREDYAYGYTNYSGYYHYDEEKKAKVYLESEFYEETKKLLLK